MLKATITILLVTTLLLQVVTVKIVIIPCYTCDPFDSKTRDINIYNAKFQGNLSVWFSVPNETCTYTETISAPDRFKVATGPLINFEVGAIRPNNNASLSREAWDENPFYFKLDAYESDTRAYLAMQSSLDRYEEANASAGRGQFWNLGAIKRGDGWDVEGWLGSESIYNAWSLSECDLWTGPHVASTNWSLTGRITNQTVNMEWRGGENRENAEWEQVWSYVGWWHNESAMINSSDETIETYGELGENPLRLAIDNGVGRVAMDWKVVGVGLVVVTSMLLVL